jgi:hypothetical protein
MIVFYVALSAGGVSAGFEEALLPQAVARQERFKKTARPRLIHSPDRITFNWVLASEGDCFSPTEA